MVLGDVLCRNVEWIQLAQNKSNGGLSWTWWRTFGYH